MAFSCTDIETLVHTYLDGELAVHDLEELEQHLARCSSCKARVDEELQFRAELRRKLVPPPAPDLLRARIGALLVAEDRAAQTAQRKRSAAWILPGAATVAAAAALVLVVAMPANDEVAQPKATSPSPASPQPSIGVAAKRYLVPDFSALGAKPRTATFDGNPEFTYEVDRNHARHELQMAIIPDARNLDAPGEQMKIGGLTMWILRANGLSAVTIMGSDGSARQYKSGTLLPDQLLDFARAGDSWLQHAPDPAP
ncbi:MAG TPA: zf-HC2 domain-containing protein [Kofleriaceae bacterium]|nr:zf-HC2 domain-containing protein [Kofleriaceae bacterium]